MSTFTPLELLRLPDASALRDEFVGRKLDSLRTPAAIVDRKAFVDNCAAMGKAVEGMGIGFRAHVKTHKTPEGSRLQVEGGARSLVASTMPEVWGLIESGLVADDKIDDILFSLPVQADKVEDINAAQEKAGKVEIRLMVDHAAQIKLLGEARKKLNRSRPWSVFIKVDGGGKRAGAPPRSKQMKELVEACIAEDGVVVYGFYSHFGQSYASKDLSEAEHYYEGEVDCVNDAAKHARSLGLISQGDWVLSVGATPTAHAAAASTTHAHAKTVAELEGVLELHAGCYCLNDLQQLATSLVSPAGAPAPALTILATVVSKYEERGEAMSDAGALAVSKDQGPFAGHGRVVSKGHEGWSLGRISQEHGTLVRTSALTGGKREDEGGKGEARELEIGEKVQIVPQHACLACACYPWLYVTDGGDKVVDVWVPWKGW